MNGNQAIFMENSSKCVIVGKGMVQLPLTSKKMLALQDMCHILDVRRDLHLFINLMIVVLRLYLILKN